jgi:hypothetical protein
MGCNTHVHGSNSRNLSYRYFYLKLAEMVYFSYYFLCFLFNKSENKKAEQVLPRSGVRGVAQIMYTHVSKCKND